jgi:hypothetical protein
MTCLGLLPAEYSTGERRRPGAMATAGHLHARRARLQGAWGVAVPGHSQSTSAPATRNPPQSHPGYQLESAGQAVSTRPPTARQRQPCQPGGRRHGPCVGVGSPSTAFRDP